MIRTAKPEDISAILAMAVAANMFSEEESPALRQALSEFFGASATEEHVWIVDAEEDRLLGAAYYSAAPMADRTWYIKMIVVSPDHQGRGRGTAIMRHIESELTERGQRMLLVETSSLPLYDRTRAFYAKCDYSEEARIRDFYKNGDDMLVFRKSLTVQPKADPVAQERLPVDKVLPTAPTHKPRIELKHTRATRWFHWINAPVLTLMIWSGLLIYWANDVYYIGWGDWVLFKFFPTWFYNAFVLHHRLAEGMAWHFTLMWVFAINGIAYVTYTFLSGEWRHLVPNRHSFKEAWQVVLHDLKLSRIEPPKRKFNGAQQFAYTGVILMGLGSLLTGLAIYKPTQLAWLNWCFGGYASARAIHFALTIGYCLFVPVHLIQVAKAGWNNFRAMAIGYEVVDEPAQATQELVHGKA